MAPSDAAPSDEFFHSVLASLPAVEYAVAYGSGVFAQQDAACTIEPTSTSHGTGATADKMVDFILAVSDPVAWHAANLRVNASHYSALGWLGARAVAGVQCARFGARIYFNTLVPHVATLRSGHGEPLRANACDGALLERRFVKYGVISVEDLRTDLLEWETLYVSGRLHKPVRTLVPSVGLEPALRSNLRSAVAAGLLSLPPSFSEQQLHTAIAALSYGGDVRMGLAEHPRKVERIVAGAQAAFRQLYAPPLLAAAAPDVVARGAGANWSQQTDGATTAARLRELPASVRARVISAVGGAPAPHAAGVSSAGNAAEPGAIAASVPREAVQAALRHCLAETVRSASAAQSIKGVLTAGAGKSAVYLASKLMKARRR